MPRTRSLKPDFFKDEDLICFPFWVRILYAGLWCQADREGRLYDRPMRLKTEIFPNDDVDVDEGLRLLANGKSYSPTHRPFIVRYEIDAERYIQVVRWHEHQNPHHTEKRSEIPPYDGDLTVGSPCLNGGRGDAHDQEIRNKKPETRTRKRPQPIAPGFDDWWARYPRRVGKQDALRAYIEVVETHAPEEVLKALEGYLAEIAHLKTEERYIKHPATFLHNERWKDYLGWAPKKQDPIQGINDWLLKGTPK